MTKSGLVWFSFISCFPVVLNVRSNCWLQYQQPSQEVLILISVLSIFSLPSLKIQLIFNLRPFTLFFPSFSSLLVSSWIHFPLLSSWDCPITWPTFLSFGWREQVFVEASFIYTHWLLLIVGFCSSMSEIYEAKQKKLWTSDHVLNWSALFLPLRVIHGFQLYLVDGIHLLPGSRSYT